MEYQDKFIAYIDILGFKKLVEDSENGTGLPLPKLIELLQLLGTSEDISRLKKNGPIICPGSKYFQRDLNFKLSQISDCVVVSSEVSPAGVINLVSYCAQVVLRLLEKGIMCRGYITKGSIYHTDSQFIGSGYFEAYSKEEKVKVFKHENDKEGTPFVELNPVVCKFVTECGDACVKKMFSRFVKDDGEISALFPFQRLSHSFIIAGLGNRFDSKKEKESNRNMRLLIEKLKVRLMEFIDTADSEGKEKVKHYIKALDEQLAVCDKTDEMIDRLG
jgi:hypothetical protein